MRRIVISFSLALIAISTVFTSCKKDELLIPSNKQEVIEENPVDNGTGENPVENSEVKIFVKSQSNLKSGAESSASEMKDGDTISFPRDINVLMYAEDQNGKAVIGNWKIELVKDDCPVGYSANDMNWYNGDQIAHKFLNQGIYKVSFGKFVDWGNNLQVITSFYVYVGGIPGKVGDDYNNNSIFRMEKRELFGNDGKKHKLFFVFFKYAKPLSPADEAIATLIIRKDNNSSNCGISFFKKMDKWQFSNDNYYYCVIDAEQENREGENYKMLFQISGGLVDPNNYASSWTNGGDGIVFSLQ